MFTKHIIYVQYYRRKELIKEIIMFKIIFIFCFSLFLNPSFAEIKNFSVWNVIEEKDPGENSFLQANKKYEFVEKDRIILKFPAGRCLMVNHDERIVINNNGRYKEFHCPSSINYFFTKLCPALLAEVVKEKKHATIWLRFPEKACKTTLTNKILDEAVSCSIVKDFVFDVCQGSPHEDEVI